MKQPTGNTMPQPLYEPRSTHTPPNNTVVGGVLNTKSCGGHSTGETPSTIPNLEAKPGSANGTATDRLWESRTPPQHNHTERDGTPHGVPSLSFHTPTTPTASSTPGVTTRTENCYNRPRIHTSLGGTPRSKTNDTKRTGQQPHQQTLNNSRTTPDSRGASVAHRARGGCTRLIAYGTTHQRTYVAHILPLGMGC